MPRNLRRFDYVFLTTLCFGVRCGRTSDTVISLPSKQDCALQTLQTVTTEDADARYDTSGVCSLAAEP